MSEPTREPVRGIITEADRLADPAAPWAMMIRWLETQRQDVWGRLILGAETADPAAPEGACLLWMIQRKMDRANAIRLFWRLYRPDLYLSPPEAPLTGADARAQAALKAIVARFGVSGYPCGQLGLSRAEARFYRQRFRAGLRGLGGRRARRQRQPAFAIPPAFFQPLPGRALEEAPTIRPVGPAPEWMGTQTEAAFGACGARFRQLVAGEAGPGFGAEMRARMRAARQTAWMIRGAVGGVTAVLAVLQASGGDMMGRLLHLMHLPLG